MTDEAAARMLFDWLMDVGDAPEVLWSATLAHVERAVEDAKESRHGRFRYNARGECRRFFERVDQARELAELAVEMIDVDHERDREMREELHAHAVEAAARSRRAQTLPAQLARIEKRRRRQDGPPLGRYELLARGWLDAAVDAHEHGRPIPPSEDYE